uniref:Tyrosine-protein phosphatase domain-containing protein n=1 Tax=Panagrolaimus sp. JU765 TaxID=591449 RepID=A0AC34RCN6_9BILA
MSAEKEDERQADDDQQSEEDDKEGVVTTKPQEIIDEICSKGEAVLGEWHEMIMKNPPKIDACLSNDNRDKNRFPNVLLYDKTRVRIRDKLGGDYYHASYVDSYDKAGGYVLAQAPFDEQTENDFWRM